MGILSQWISPDSTNSQLQKDSSMALRQELEWAQHLSLQAVMLSELSCSGGVANTARILLQVSSFPGSCELIYCTCDSGYCEFLNTPRSVRNKLTISFLFKELNWLSILSDFGGWLKQPGNMDQSTTWSWFRTPC